MDSDTEALLAVLAGAFLLRYIAKSPGRTRAAVRVLDVALKPKERA